MDQLLSVFSNINNFAKSRKYQEKYEDKQETALQVTQSRSAEPLTKESHGWKNCLYDWTNTN